MRTEDLSIVLEKNALWVKGKEGGERANLSEADLSEADLSGANLSEADLFGANLRRANLSGAEGIVAINFCGYPIVIQRECTTIGCQNQSNDYWMSLSNDDALKMGADINHLEFYRQQIKLGVEFLKAQTETT